MFCKETMPSGIFVNEAICKALLVTKIIIWDEMQTIPTIKLEKLFRAALFWLIEIFLTHLLSCLLLYSQLTCGTVKSKNFLNHFAIFQSLPETFKVRYMQDFKINYKEYFLEYTITVRCFPPLCCLNHSTNYHYYDKNKSKSAIVELQALSKSFIFIIPINFHNSPMK